MDPMIIVFPSGHNGFGGGFYTDSWHPSVKGSEAHIMRVIGEVDANYNTDPTPAKRAIGGHSMGGYGAMRLALRFPNTFGSIGVLAGPLAFWGTMPSSTQFKGLAEILPSVLQETGYDTILAANPAGDLTAYRQMMYPAATRRVTSMMFAAAAAFSPTNPGNMEPISLVGYGVDLPINVDGQLYMPTWNRWLTHDPLAMFAGGAAANLAGVNIYLDAGARDDLGFAYSHDVFAGALLQAGMPASVKLTFVDASDGAGGTVPADHTLHTYERIKKMLIWQSNQF
jgi:S-formylglutathione hydrolase FrmB